ncbi:MAG: DUF1415 domain-containing protein [Rhodanobacteraceae bacterium]|nr:DUF1415 domain-containing protein [Rhodanobacteraceae bacterium]
MALETSPDAPEIAATRRWLEQVVIGLNLCPFARAPHLKGRVRFVLSPARNEDELVADLLDIADATVQALGLEGELQVASFHPDYQFGDAEPDAVENCTNRSPYPTLHLLREASIERAVEAVEDTDAIYQRNIETLRRIGWEGWEKLK